MGGEVEAMNKSTQNLLWIGGGIAVLYYLYQNGLLGGAAGSAETPAELLASTNATVAANLNAFNAAAGT
jgi:hypothetical protein